MKEWIDEKVEYLHSRIGRIPQKDFLFEPTKDFYATLERIDLIPPLDEVFRNIENDKPPYVTFSAATESIAKHLGRDVPRIEFQPLESTSNGRNIAGQIQIGGWSEKIEISSQFKAKALQLGRIFAHEISHDFLHSQGIMLPTTEENERLTDLASFMLGLGKLVLNGMEGRTGLHIVRLGYLPPSDMAYAYVTINALYGVPVEKSLTNLTYTAKNLVKPLIDKRNVKEARSLIGTVREKSSEVQNRLDRYKKAYYQIIDNQSLINAHVESLTIDRSDGAFFVDLNSYSFVQESEGFARHGEFELNEIQKRLSNIEQGLSIDRIPTTIKSLELLDARMSKLTKDSERSLDKLLEALCVQEKYLNQRSGLVIERFQELIREKEIEKALNLAVKADCRVLRDVGVEYAKKNNPLAVEVFDKIIQLDPEDAGAYFNRGNVYRDLNQYDRAIADYTHALDVNPTYANAYINRGNVYSRLERYVEAISDYDSALKLRSSYKAYVNRGNAYLYLNRFSEAIEDFQTALDLATVDVTNRARDDLLKAFSLLREKGGFIPYAKIRGKMFVRTVLKSRKRTQNQHG